MVPFWGQTNAYVTDPVTSNLTAYYDYHFTTFSPFLGNGLCRRISDTHADWVASSSIDLSCIVFYAVVYRYHGIFETVYYRQAFPNTVHPYYKV